MYCVYGIGELHMYVPVNAHPIASKIGNDILEILTRALKPYHYHLDVEASEKKENGGE